MAADDLPFGATVPGEGAWFGETGRPSPDDTRGELTRLLAFAGYLACIIGANLALKQWGMVEVLGYMLPAGVWFAGASFSLRDVLDDLGGRLWVIAAIVAGGLISLLIAPSFAVASAAAFLLSEAFDWAVYSPLRERRWVVAVILSNVVGSIVDSLVFLHLAFGSTSGWLPLTVAKAVVTVPFVLVIGGRRAVSRHRIGA